jgi:low affinity Fe/Cu permease
MLYRTSPFSRFARSTALMLGNPVAFVIAVLIIIVWATTGPLFHFSDTWQLIINTSTTIVTFLMVFLIQNTQNRDSEAIQLKLDELIRAVEGAHNGLLDIEELTEEELKNLRVRYTKLATKAREDLGRGRKDTGTPQV